VPHPLPLARGIAHRRGQVTVEWLGLAAAIAALLGVVALGPPAELARTVARGLLGDRSVRQGDRWALTHPHWGAVIRHYAPVLVLERDRHGDDTSVPVDFRSCRERACAAYRTGRPTAFVHVLRRDREYDYVAYFFYYPDSQTSHLPLAALRGRHDDDWESVVVRIDQATGAAAARASAHGGFAGAGPWWSPASGWVPIDGPPVVYRAAGSHAGGFVRRDVDLAGDAWNGDLATIDDLLLLPADEAPAARRRFDPAASPPWLKAAWSDPEVPGTGRDGSRGRLAHAAEAWARARGWLPRPLRPSFEAPRRGAGAQPPAASNAATIRLGAARRHASMASSRSSSTSTPASRIVTQP
jgi:hypothetical protein